jgi:uncharacterized membrane protein YidH (DUF202 family)
VSQTSGGDPGLARERTSLAWTRTAIAFAAIGALLVKKDLAVGVVILVLSAVVRVVGRLGRAPERVRGRPRQLLLIALAVTGVSLVALVITLWGTPSSGLRLP